MAVAPDPNKYDDSAVLDAVSSEKVAATMEEDQNLDGLVAIVGMGMRLPGSIRTPEDLWRTLVEKRSTRCEIPPSRFSVEGFHRTDSKVGSIIMRHGYFLADTDSIGHLDTSLFSMGRLEVSSMDPQQRILLEVVHECMESAGQVNWRGKNIGCYVGSWGEDWLDLCAKDAQYYGRYRLGGTQDFALANRISYEYDLKGPSFTIKSGCSSSLIALHQAMRAIQYGDCDGAVVGGTNLIFSPTNSIIMSQAQGVLSPDATCKTFDAAADGYGRGEAINAIFLKPLKAAIDNKDPIRAVVRAASSNADGKTSGLLVPSPEAHEELLRKVYKQAGLDPTQTVYVEAHGTGTPVGDPAEAGAIARVFGAKDDRKTYMGSIKPSIGHSEGASGLSSVFKAVLALEHKAIPPNINYSTPNPKIPFQEAHLEVPRQLIPWPTDHALRVSVNSFGIGGANAHCIIESAGLYVNKSVSVHHHAISSEWLSMPNGSQETTGSSTIVPEVPKRLLWVVSAATTHSLSRSIEEHQDYHRDHRGGEADVSYTLCNRREHRPHRAYALVPATFEDEEPVTPEFYRSAKKVDGPHEVIMVFTGQGAQWAGMSRKLLACHKTFRDTIFSLRKDLSQLQHPPDWDLVDELSKQGESSNVNLAEFAQPLVCAIQVALVNLLRTWDITPAAVVGHSSGEIAAAYASGAITAKEAITIAYYRGLITKHNVRTGAMAAVGLGPGEVAPYLAEGTLIACENSPESVTLSGDKDALQQVCDTISREKPECFVRLLKVNIAYHSHHMQDVGGDFESLLKSELHCKAPKVPFFSSVRVTQLQEPGCVDASYWRENLENPVRFNGAVKLLLDTRAQQSEPFFIEIGPHSALAGPLRQIFRGHGGGQELYAAAMVRGNDCVESILGLAGELFLHGIPINFSNIAPQGSVVTNLPLYSWDHQTEYWSEAQLCADWRFRKFPHHELLGSRTLESSSLQPEWRNVIQLDRISWLRDHQIADDIIFPTAGYIAMAVEAVRQVSGVSEEVRGVTLKSIVVHSAMVLLEDNEFDMLTTLQPLRLTDTLDAPWWEFAIYAHNGVSWVKRCDGQVMRGSPAHHTEPTSRDYNNNGNARNSLSYDYPRTMENLYLDFQRLGLNYGPYFRGLETVSCQPTGMKAAGFVRERTASGPMYPVHPTTIDHCLQLIYPASCDGAFYRVRNLSVPTHIAGFYVSCGGSTDISLVEASSRRSYRGSITADVAAFSSVNGSVLLAASGCELSSLESESDENAVIDLAAAAELKWMPHVDFADANDLLRPVQDVADDTKDMDMLERLTLLSILEIHQRITNGTGQHNEEREHLQRFRGWIASEVVESMKG